MWADVGIPVENKPIEKEIGILFYEIKPENNNSADIANILTDVLSTEIINNKSFSIIRVNDLTLKTELEKRGIVGCQNTDECLSLFSKAMDMDYLVSGSAGEIGESYTAILTILDVRQNKLILRESIVTPKNISEIITRFVEAFNKFAMVYRPRQNAERQDNGKSKDLNLGIKTTIKEEKKEVAKSNNLVDYLLLGSGVAVIGLGGLFTYNAYIANENFKAGDNPDYWGNRVDFYNTLSITSYILGVGLVVASGVMFYLDYEK